LNQLGLPWGPIGSVGFELATGQAATSPDSDLDLIVRVPDLQPATVDGLWSLHDSHFRHLSARVDCLVEGPAGTIGMTELASGARALTVTSRPRPQIRPPISQVQKL
jgi:phosphoribosyl-dephospho-CoA transferase